VRLMVDADLERAGKDAHMNDYIPKSQTPGKVSAVNKEPLR